ncbi:DNRLRE domain-containing protein [Spirosoma aureum]|uniref:DNRLRE domain-containing protein n=1 Tax=Spirosoma aureum TaxID=2692134 RepID=A0A6G9ATV8_9BACT|nr:polysaccharide lyase family 8 super-sandwich domain-containing protein [Spirosoma aureum]QIP15840.1 DNRLRE domain-containing protein [Spirosoma aureum]
MTKYCQYLLNIAILIYSHSAFSQTNIDKVRSAIISSNHFNSKYVLPASALPTDTILAHINADGSFKTSMSAPTPEDLTSSIFKISYVFKNPDSTAYYQNATVKDKLYKSLNYWLSNYPAFTWTSSAMAQPTALGMILLKLYDNFQADQTTPAYSSLIANIRTRSNGFVRYSWSNGKTIATLTNPNLGTNPTDDWHRMGNLGYRLFGYSGIMAANNDSTSLDTLSIMVGNQFSLQINKPNSPVIAALYDGSMHQHGPQTYNIGYGIDWVNDLGRFAGWVKNSKWKLTTNQQQAWGDILLNGMQWMVYKGRSAHNIVGRHNSLTGNLSRSITGQLNEFLGNADATLPQYASILALNNKLSTPNAHIDSTKYLWNSNLILHHSSRYFASIKMLSNRTVGVESSDAGIGHGLMNFHVGDGSTMIYRTGIEYNNARVGWNWRAIPGTTIKQKTGTLPLVPWTIGYESDNTLAGGVSDGTATIGMFSLSRTNAYHKTKAFKSYFAFKDILLCLGNSINDTDIASGDVYTTLNQCERITDITYKINGGSEQTIALGSSADLALSITSPSWFWHDSTGYIIIPASSLATSAILKAENRNRNWYTLDKRNVNAPVSVNIFQLSINHGSSAGWNDRTYRYVVVPAVSKTDLITFFTNKIINQDSESLYINYNDSRIISASYNGYTGVFFPGSGTGKASGLGADNLSISTTNYAAVLVKRKTDGLAVHVSDIRNGFYTNNTVQLGVNRRLQANSFTPPRANGSCTLTPSTDTTRISVTLSKTSQLYEGEPVQISALFEPVTTVKDSLVASADAYVQDGTYVTTNYGASNWLVVKKDAASYARETYLKFNVSSVSAPVVSAKVRLYGSAGTDAAITQWQLYKVTDNSWTETGIIWNNKPAASSLVATQTGKVAQGYTEWDVTSQLQTLPSDGLLSLKLISTVIGSDTYASFYSKESGTVAWRPYLVFETAQSGNPNARLNSDRLNILAEADPNQNNLTIYPNPATTECWVQSEKTIKKITVYNASGILLNQILNLNTKQHTLCLDGLVKGSYIIVITGDDFRETRKLIKSE